MADTASTVIKLEADVSGLRAELNAGLTALQQTTTRMDSELAKFSKKTDKNLGLFRLSWANALGNIGADMLQGALSMAGNALGAFFTQGVGGAIEAENNLNQLNQALKNSGIYSAKTSADLEEFANALSTVTKFEDDSIIKTQALLQNIAQLDQEGLKGATKATLDLAQAMGLDLETAAKAVGKAANGEVGALSKFGIEIKKGTTDANTFANALQALNARFGGAAESAGKTFDGARTAMGNTWSNVMEDLGKVITTNGVLIDVMRAVTKEIGNLGVWVNNNKDAIRDWVTTGLLIAVESLDMLNNAFDYTVRGLKAVGLAATGEFSAAADAINTPIQASDALRGALERIRTAAIESRGTIKSALDEGKDETVASRQSVRINKELEEMKNKAAEAGRSLAESLNKDQSQYETKKKSVNADFNVEEDSVEAYQARMDEMRKIEEDYYAEQAISLANARNANLITEAEFSTAKAALAEQFALKQTEINTKMVQADQTFNKRRQENFRSSLGVIATLQQSSSKELFAIGKAAAMAQATIDGIAAVQKALTAAPPPFNFALAALVGVASAVNLGKIAAAKPPGFAKGIDSVPGIGSMDNFPAILAPGERVVPQQTNRDLTAFLRDRGGEAPAGNTYVVNVNIAGNVLDRREFGMSIVEAINEAYRSVGVRISGGAIA